MIKINVNDQEKMSWIEQQGIAQHTEVVEWVMDHDTFERKARVIALVREQDQILYHLKFGSAYGNVAGSSGKIFSLKLPTPWG